MRDTHPDVERVRIDLLRRAGSGRRATLASNLTNSALERARRGIALANPGLSELEQRLLFVEVHYGHALAPAPGAFRPGELLVKSRDTSLQ